MFAIVELLRAVAAFMIAPIFAHFALNVSGGLDEGVGIALWIGFALAVLGGVVPVVLYWLGGARPEKPDVEALPRRREARLLLAAAARPPAELGA